MAITNIYKGDVERSDIQKIYKGTTLLYEKVLDVTYEDYARELYLDCGKSNQFAAAWESSLTVDPTEINSDGQPSSQRGIPQYPNGETEGVIIPHGVTRIGDNAFYDWTSNNQPLVIPNSVTNIGTNAFRSWTSNNQPLVIPNSVTSISSSVFNGWSSNNQPLVISDSMISTGITAFRNWTSNTHPLVIPSSLASIAQYLFDGWKLVPYVEMKRTTPPTLANANAFRNQNNAPIYVPDESVDAYKTATNWVNLASRIFPISDK